MPRSFRIGARRFLASAALGAQLSACATWQVQEVSPQELLETKHPNRIRLTRADSTTVELAMPRLMGDTIVGARAGRYEKVATADVTQVAVRGDGGSGAAVAGIAVAGGILLLLMVKQVDDIPWKE